jgi:hypothetical protein
MYPSCTPFTVCTRKFRSQVHRALAICLLYLRGKEKIRGVPHLNFSLPTTPLPKLNPILYPYQILHRALPLSPPRRRLRLPGSMPAPTPHPHWTSPVSPSLPCPVALLQVKPPPSSRYHARPQDTASSVPRVRVKSSSSSTYPQSPASSPNLQYLPYQGNGPNLWPNFHPSLFSESGVACD